VPTQTPLGKRPALEVLHEVARTKGLPFMPVAWTDSDDRHLKMVRDAIDADGHGLALRHRIGDALLPTGQEPDRLLAKRLEELDCTTSDADLLIDLEYLNPDSETSARWAAGIIAQSCRVGTWRSIVLVGTSVPPSFGNGLVPEQSTRELPRREWALWKEVAQVADVQVAFGDYAVQNPTPPLNPPPVGPWGNIRYTTEETLLVARGLDTRIYGPEQYVELSSWVASHASFRGAAFSDGDAEILRWSKSPAAHPLVSAGPYVDHDGEDEEEEIGSASSGYWRGVGTSHHIELVTEQLRQQ